MDKNDFRFGLETEYVVLEKSTGQALWHTDLKFEKLNRLMENVSLDGIPALDGLELEKPHSKHMPFVVEGYHLPDFDFQANELLPKGVEIRTPVCKSIEECLDVQKKLLTGLSESLATEDYSIAALSHHPYATEFSGPQNKRRHDYWQWSMEVMTTYGPDINVGLPEEVWTTLDQKDFMHKINHYAAAMSAFSLASPFRNGELWRIRGDIGLSLRSYRRSIIAPPIEIHPNENRRLEFKIFDMATSRSDYEGFFLLFLTLLLDGELAGRASNATRIYDAGSVALTGFDDELIRQKASQLLERAQIVLPRWGFSARGLSSLESRFDEKRTRAHDLIERYESLGGDLPKLLLEISKDTLSFKSHESRQKRSSSAPALEARV